MAERHPTELPPVRRFPAKSFARVARARARPPIQKDLEEVGARVSLPSATTPRHFVPKKVGSWSPTVFLESTGPSPIMVIKVIRDHTGLGLAESKHLADSAPCTLADGWDAARAEQFRQALVAAGARVRAEAP